MCNIEALTGYKPKTTFWDDFTIADLFGIRAIKDTYNRAFKEWKDNTVYLTELVMVLNHKIWEHHLNKNPKYAMVYDELFKLAEDYAYDKLEGEDLDYFMEVTD